ncbi:hypothetical protein B0H17DRAFT_1195428 [Mycena rosella]|uniref:Uncharacterized protein n=1 Tax=Mycena rosella TaxID=1033263 RepID=A0AAD7DW47_MYCRO|nr:hypothetical protein B0H17DRAFT_1195428 [Mycena rosella]
MVRGCKPLDPQDKAQNRRALLAKYAEKNKERLQAAARVRVRLNRAARADADNETKAATALKVREAAAKYCDIHREKIRAAQTTCRARKYSEWDGLEAFDEMTTQEHSRKTQRRHEGELVVYHPRTLPLKRQPREESSDDEEDTGRAA